MSIQDKMLKRIFFVQNYLNSTTKVKYPLAKKQVKKVALISTNFFCVLLNGLTFVYKQREHNSLNFSDSS